MGIAFIYSGFVLFERWQSSRAAEETAERQRAERDAAVIDKLGGGELKVLMFYANPPSISKGSATRLCYGVAFADSVRVEPPVADVRPSLNHCVEAKPEQTTTYKLTAADASGSTRTSTVEVTVR